MRIVDNFRKPIMNLKTMIFVAAYLSLAFFKVIQCDWSPNVHSP